MSSNVNISSRCAILLAMTRADIRMPEEMLDRLDRLTDELRAAHPAESISRARVARALLMWGLGALALGGGACLGFGGLAPAGGDPLGPGEDGGAPEPVDLP